MKKRTWSFVWLSTSNLKARLKLLFINLSALFYIFEKINIMVQEIGQNQC